MAAEASKTTSFRWPIVEFHKQYDSKLIYLTSESFALKTRPTTQIGLYFWLNSSNPEGEFLGIALKQHTDNKAIKFNIKFWLENEKGDRFCEHFHDNKELCEIDEQRVFMLNNKEGKNYDLFLDVYHAHKTLFICCELVDIGNDKSNVLKSLTQSDMVKHTFFTKEEAANKNKEFSKDVLKGLIHWYHKRQIVVDQNLIEELFAASDKYQYHSLKKACVKNMVSTLNNNNILFRLSLADLYNSKRLKKATLEYIDRMSKDELVDIYKSPELGKLYCKNTEVAGDVIKVIREKVFGQ